MKIVEVSPITNKISTETLTYYSSKDLEIGDIVSIPIRNKISKGIVLNLNELKNEKINIRKSNFSFKKIKEVNGKLPFYKDFLKTVNEMKDFFVGNSGQIINFFIPNLFLENIEKINSPIKKEENIKKTENSILIDNIENRINFYKKYFNNLVKNNKSAILVVPTKNELAYFKRLLEIDFPNIKTLEIKNKKVIENYNEIVQNKNSQILITTPSFLFTPIYNLDTIILENETWQGYKSIKRPYFDIRTFTKKLSENLNVNLILSGDVVSVENFLIKKHNTENKNICSQTPEIIDMTDKENIYKKSFTISKKVREILNNGGKNFIFVIRKGLASQIICHDCKHILQKDDEPVTLIQKNDQRFFRGVYSKKIFDTKIRCEICGGWNFDSLGIGIDGVVEEIKKEFPKINLFQIDKDSNKTDKTAKKTYSDFIQKENGVLIGTEMAIPYIKDKIDNCIIISIDSLLFIPSFKINEKIIRLVSELSNVSKNKLTVQTRQNINYLRESLVKNDINFFYEKELEKRKSFKYPPFVTIIKIIKKDKKNNSKEAEKLIEKLKEWNPSLNTFKKMGFFENIIIIKIDLNEWNESYQNPKIKEILSSLGPDWQVKVNPDSLF